MSHFSVLVIGKNIEEQLAPYEESLKVEFKDTSEEYLTKYENESVEKIKLEDGTLVDKWDDKFRVPNTYGLGSNTHVVPENLERVSITFKELYPTFFAYMKDWCGEVPNVEGKYGYWNNPKAQWDWYLLGGRWTGFFKLKSGAEGKKGKPGTMTDPAKSGFADQAMIKDIDFEGMREEASLEAEAQWDLVLRFLGGKIPKIEKPWKELIARENLSYDEKRILYHAQDAIVAFNKITDNKEFPSLTEEQKGFVHFLNADDFQCTKEEYIERAKRRAISTYAVVKDGEWYQRGKMGWFGASQEELSEDEWEKKFSDLLKDLSPDTIVSLVDCHT